MKFYPKAISSIAFGLRMEKRDKDTLLKLLSGSEWSHLKWFQAVKVLGRFTLNFEEIKI